MQHRNGLTDGTKYSWLFSPNASMWVVSLKMTLVEFIFYEATQVYVVFVNLRNNNTLAGIFNVCVLRVLWSCPPTFKQNKFVKNPRKLFVVSQVPSEVKSLKPFRKNCYLMIVSTIMKWQYFWQAFPGDAYHQTCICSHPCRGNLAFNRSYAWGKTHLMHKS